MRTRGVSKSLTYSVMEIFTEENYMGIRKLIRKESQRREEDPPYLDRSSWGLIDQDKERDEPVVYLRIDCNQYNRDTSKKINEIYSKFMQFDKIVLWFIIKYFLNK